MDIMRPWPGGVIMDIMTPPWSHNGNFPNFPCGAGQKK
jgi:hypothetical protein